MKTSNKSFQDHQQPFIDHLEHKGKSFNTIKNYKTDLNIFFRFLTEKHGSTKISEISAQVMSDYNSYLEKKYNSPNSRRRRVQALRLYFDWMIENSLTDHNPIKKISSPAKVVDIPRPVSYSTILKLQSYIEEQIKTARSNLEELIFTRNLMVVHLIYGSALKVSDIENLKESHLFLGETTRIMVCPKKRDPYTIRQDSAFNSLWSTYSALLKEQKKLNDISFDDFLFNANPYRILNGSLSARGIEVILKDYSKKIDSQVTAKSIRQSCIFKWISKNIKTSQIKEWMGVAPNYSLTPYLSLYKEDPSQYTFRELGESN